MCVYNVNNLLNQHNKRLTLYDADLIDLSKIILWYFVVNGVNVFIDSALNFTLHSWHKALSCYINAVIGMLLAFLFLEFIDSAMLEVIACRLLCVAYTAAHFSKGTSSVRNL